MTSFLFLLTVASWVLLAWFWWSQKQEEEEKPQSDDKRVSLLLRGINYLLSDDHDRALQELVSVAKIHTETAEVYLALGGLFRTKGEIGRAVRIHQNLLARPDLPGNLHIQACLALGLDYQAGGFFDRSLRQFAKVIEMQSDNTQALESCLRIREQSQEWALAEGLLLRLDKIRGSNSTLHLAYLQAEVAREYLNKGDAETAISEAEKALQLDKNCAAAHLLLTEIFLGQHDSEEALSNMRRLSQVAAQHLPLLVSTLVNSREVYSGGGYDFLLSCWHEARNDALALAWIEAEYETSGPEAASRLIQKLGYEPEHLRSCLQLIALTGQREMENIQSCTSEWYQCAKHYVCNECGVEMASMHWQCAQCHHWGSMTPITGENAP